MFFAFLICRYSGTEYNFIVLHTRLCRIHLFQKFVRNFYCPKTLLPKNCVETVKSILLLYYEMIYWQRTVTAEGKEIGIGFGFGFQNSTDTSLSWKTKFNWKLYPANWRNKPMRNGKNPPHYPRCFFYRQLLQETIEALPKKGQTLLEGWKGPN